jgi:hypothetical protein
VVIMKQIYAFLIPVYRWPITFFYFRCGEEFKGCQFGLRTNR